jgi:hypothetical protein
MRKITIHPQDYSSTDKANLNYKKESVGRPLKYILHMDGIDMTKEIK